MVMTLHRPSNVDHKDVFTPLVDFLTEEVSGDMPLFWPIHPRARKQLETFGLWDQVVSTPNLVLLQPIGYHDMLRLNMNAKLFLTDSGGLQEECTILGTPCLTLRWNTERPITLWEFGVPVYLLETTWSEFVKNITMLWQRLVSRSGPNYGMVKPQDGVWKLY